MSKLYFVYILTNRRRGVLYTGVTNDLKRRVLEHKSAEGGKFTRRYRTTRLVYYEVADTAYAAISREKQLKAGPRMKKVELIERVNPEWKDLYGEI